MEVIVSIAVVAKLRNNVLELRVLATATINYEHVVVEVVVWLDPALVQRFCCSFQASAQLVLGFRPEQLVGVEHQIAESGGIQAQYKLVSGFLVVFIYPQLNWVTIVVSVNHLQELFSNFLVVEEAGFVPPELAFPLVHGFFVPTHNFIFPEEHGFAFPIVSSVPLSLNVFNFRRWNVLFILFTVLFNELKLYGLALLIVAFKLVVNFSCLIRPLGEGALSVT